MHHVSRKAKNKKHLRMRWEAIMRGTWVFVVAVGRMVLNVCGRGADGRMALGIFWKSEKVAQGTCSDSRARTARRRNSTIYTSQKTGHL